MKRIVYDRICIMCPTYGRAETKLSKFIDSMLKTVKDVENIWESICATFVVKKSDEASIKVINDLCGGRIDYELIYEDTTECDLAHYFNLAYKKSKFKEETTCVSMFGDDFVFVTEGWDRMILEKINDIFGIGFVYGDDDNTQHDDLCVYFVTTRTFVELTGKSFMCKLFAVDYIDNVWMEVGRKLNCAVYLPNLHIRHEHVTRDGEPDSVWLRMRKQYDLSHRCRIMIDDYSTEIANNVRKNLAERYLSKDISYCMTVYDRVMLLQRTVTSWNKSVLLPETIFVFDDGSKSIDKVRIEIDRMWNAHFVQAEKHYGCDKRNVFALTYFDTPAVMVIDSDTVFAPHWCIAVNLAWETIKDDPDIAGVTIFNTHLHKIARDGSKDFLTGLIRKQTVGGFGTVFKRETIDNAFDGLNIEEMPKLFSWDNHVNDIVQATGREYCSTEKSYVQHIGFAEGMHVSDEEKSDYAEDFVGKVEDPREVNNEAVPIGSTVLFAVMARIGDVIAASMIANMIIDKGLKLTWLVIKRNERLVRTVCPLATIRAVEPLVGGPMGEWSEITTDEMHAKHGNFFSYINAQVGARENHNLYLMSGEHPCVWMRNLCSRILGIPLEGEFRSYLRFEERLVNLAERDVGRLPENLAIIAPTAITSQSLTDEKIEEVYGELKGKGYAPKILTEKRPERMSIREAREKYIYGLTIEQCILLIREAKFFVGQDSGLSWCSLYSSCQKRIYHKRSRIDKTNTYFSTIDEKIEDVVLED